MSTKMTPQLRFPEFTDEWQVRKLGDIAEFSKGSSISKNDIHEDGKIEAIRYGELYTTYSEVIDEVQSRTNLSPNGLKFSKANDVIVPASGETAIDIATASCVLRDNIALSGDLNIIRTHNDGVFMAYYLNNKKKNDIARLAQGVSVIHLYSSNLKDLEVNLPSKPEQEKIADFLTAVDERIAVGEKKLELLETYKRGVMQKIFTQQIRFKDENGKPYLDWEEKRLGEVGRIVGGGTPETSNPKYWNGEINWLTPTEVKQKYITKSNKTISENGLKNSSATLLPVGAVIFTSRATVGDVAISKIELTTNQGFQSIIVNNENDNQFIYYWILQNKNEFLRRANGSTFPEISKNEMGKVKILKPSHREQQKIATFLTALDNKITAEKSKLTAAKKFKKALLQRMFV